MPTAVLNNGLFVRDTNYEVSSHLDSYHLKNMLGESKPTDLGPVDLWAMAQKVEMPLYQMANFGGKNTIEVNNARGEYTWQTAVVNDLPYIIEDIEPADAVLGQDETFFKIKLNKRAFGHGDIITYDKMNGLELYVTNEDILPAGGDGFIYTIQLVNKDTARAMDRKYLKSGTKYFRIGSAKSGEYGQKFSDIGQVNAGFREYFNFVGNAEAHVEWSISNKADLMIKNGMNANGTIPVTELWRSYDENLKNDPSLTTIESIAKKMGKDYIKKGMAEGTLSRAFLTKMEAVHLGKIATDIETYLMWGKGGKIRNTEGPDDIRLSVGLWAQLDNSYKRIYNVNTFSLELFKSEIFNYFNGKVEFTGPNPNKTIVVQTGMAGMKQVSEAIQREARNMNLVLNATELGAITNTGQDLNFAGINFTSFTIPFLAHVKFVLNPAFDNLHTNDIENPIVNGYPLSSYSYIVFDIVDNVNDNIFLLKMAWDHELQWYYQNGSMDYLGRNGHQSSGDFSGYKVKMQQRMPAIWVKDPSRVLKIVMKNPITGGSF